MIEAAVILLLAAGFRLRGDAAFHRWTGRGATTARLVAWALPVGLSGFALGLGWWSLVLGVAAWAGSLLGWWGSLDLGRQFGGFWRDFALHSARGVMWTAPMAAVLFVAGGAWWWLLAAGALCGALYEAGYRAWPARGTEVGEGLFGGAIGAALVLA